jgi:YidC/Oxa1 family membrane protein insertase
MLMLPLFFAVLIPNFPAGLILYWITTNFWTLGQSFVVKWMRIRQGDPVLVGDKADAGDAVVTSGGAAIVEKKPTKAPPPPPRTKKKRSGRRR